MNSGNPVENVPAESFEVLNQKALAGDADANKRLREILAQDDFPDTPSATADVKESAPPEAGQPDAIPVGESPASIPDTDEKLVLVADPKNPEFRERYKQKADELNTASQKLRNLERELEEVRKKASEQEAKLREKPSVNEDVDVYDENALKQMRRDVAEIRAKQDAALAAQKEAESRRTQQLEEEAGRMRMEREFLEIETFQAHNPRYATKVPFRKLNDDYAHFVTLIGGIQNVERYQRDPAYKRQMEAQGVKAPDELPKLLDVLKMRDFKTKQGYPTLTSAYYDYTRENVLDERVAQVSLDTANLVRAKLDTVAKQTSTLPAEGAGGGHSFQGDAGWTPEKAQAWLKSHPNPTSDADVAVLRSVMSWLKTQSN